MLQATDKFSKMKIRWWTHNHCLFVVYLANVAIGYGWISDTKFQKFSDKDWIWVCKNFFVYRSGVKKSISAHLCCSGERSFSRFNRIKNESKGHNVPGEVVHTKHSVHWNRHLGQTNWNEFLDNFVVKKAGQSLFNCVVFSLAWFDDCSFLFLYTYFNDSISEI